VNLLSNYYELNLVGSKDKNIAEFGFGEHGEAEVDMVMKTMKNKIAAPGKTELLRRKMIAFVMVLSLLYYFPDVCRGAEAVQPISPLSFSVTQDRFDHKPRLNVTMESDLVFAGEKSLQDPVRFFIYTDYPAYIDHYRISVFAEDDIESKFPLHTIDLKEVNVYEPIVWDGKSGDRQLLKSGVRYRYILEAFDVKGHRDVTLAKFFRVNRQIDGEKKKAIQTVEIPGFGIDATAQRGITPQGSRVVLQGRNLPHAYNATLNNQKVAVDLNGNLVCSYLLPEGKHSFVLKLYDEKGILRETQNQDIDLAAGSDETFFVGLVDITLGKNTVTGSIEPLAQDDHFNGKLYKDGRIAFYLKGKVKGKYLLTAQMDTGEDGLSKIFKQIGEKDSKRIFREIDPDRYYPVYGDDSTLTTDVNTQGKFYVKLENNKSHLLWGNFNTAITGTELSQYNRSLYGLQIVSESPEETKFGDAKKRVSAFLSAGETRQDHNEFLSTGGSLYYLIHQRVTEGSEKVYVEVRDKDSGRVKGKSILVQGADYQIDNYQGRLLLSTPLSLKAASDTIISSGLLNGDNLVLVIDYEYYSDSVDFNARNTGGLRAYNWFGDHFKLGGTYIQENREGSDYKLSGLDAVLKLHKGTYFNFEYAKSHQLQTPGYYSNDGGLTFQSLAAAIGASDQGRAWKVEQVADFREFTNDKLPLTFRSYYLYREKGFSSLALNTANESKEYGMELQYKNSNDSGTLTLKNSTVTEAGVSVEKTTTVQMKNNLKPGLRSIVELRDRKESDASIRESDVIGAVRLEKDVTPKTTVYAGQQVTMSRDDGTPLNNKSTLGVVTRINDKLAANVEGFTGKLGGGGSVGLTSDFSTKTHLYSRFTADVDRTSGRTHAATFGGDYQINDKTDFYSERQFLGSSIDSSTADVYGVKYLPDKQRVYDFKYTLSSYKSGSGSLLNQDSFSRREGMSFGYGFNGTDKRIATRVEWREDRGSERKVQYVTSNSGKYVANKQTTWYGKFDGSITENRTTGKDDAHYMEASIGAAYRPIKNDRLNILTKMTWLHNLGADFTDIDVDNNLIVRDNNTDEKSAIFSVEAIYDLSKRFNVGAKYAYKTGSMRLRDGDGSWASSDTRLEILRLNYHLTKEWDALLEYRLLSSFAAQDDKSGWLAGVYRHINKTLMLGVGYNFTNFNDDLTNLNYKSRGWFVNMIGSW